MHTDLSPLSEQQAREALLSGQTLRQKKLPALVFQDVVFPHSIRLIGCHCDGLVFDQCTFEDTLTLQGCTFAGEVSLSRESAESTFQRDVSLETCVFEGKVEGRKVAVHGDFSCQGAVFHERLSLPQAHFIGRFNASEAQFLSTCRWEGAQFGKTTSFERAVFTGKADFRQANFQDTAFFRNVRFCDEATFQNAIFTVVRFEELHAMGKITFKVAQFHGKAYFHHARFDDILVLRGADIRDIFYFNHVTCQGRLDGQGMECLHTVTFDQVQLQDDVEWTDAVFHRDVNVRESVIKGAFILTHGIFRMRLDCTGTQLHGTIGLYGVNADELLLDRKQLEGRLQSAQAKDYERAKHVYVLLRNHFEQQGKHEDADWAYYLFRQAERKSDTTPGFVAALQRFFNWFLFDLGSGYGTRPINVTILAAVVIFAFAGLFWTFSDQFVIDANIRGLQAQGMSFPQALYLSATTFTTLGTDGIAPRFDNWLKYFVVIEGFLGLFLMTVFVGVYTRKMAK